MVGSRLQGNKDLGLDVNGHRQFLAIQGDAPACRDRARRLLADCAPVWVSALPGHLGMGQVRDLLGQEVRSLVFDAHGGFNPDAFAAACGLVVGGGVLVLLIPPLEVWQNQHDPEARRLAVFGYQLEQQSNRFICRLANQLVEADVLTTAENGETYAIECIPWSTAATDEQAQAVAAVERVATGHRRRPLVLTADRGRGKSSAFGIAAANLLQQGRKRVLVTAPRLDAAQALFRHAMKLLPLAHQEKGVISWEDQQIRFVAPDALIIEQPEADLLLVDEAAGIPLPLLQVLVKRYSRIAFATTIHGYEGTGRGFVLRFNQMLDQVAPRWRRMHLEQPIRWSERDPLEAFSFNALLLDAEPADSRLLASIDTRQLVLQRLSRDQLLQDEVLLRQLFGLLVGAHYRTTPFDLRHLLDGPNVSVWLARHQGNVAAAILAADEGGFDEEISKAIWLGQRRPHGHLVPEALAAQSGIEQAPRLNYLRIIRIAVHPALQGRGVGSTMLEQLLKAKEIRQLDAVGVSYGASSRLLPFWRRAGFTPVRVGLVRDARSGTHALLMLRGISRRGRALEAEARSGFYDRLPVQLSEPLRDLEPDLAVGLLCGHESGTLADLDELRAFAGGARHYGDSLLSLRRLVLRLAASDFDGLPEGDAGLLVAKILQGRSWNYVAALFQMDGRKQVQQRLREIVRTCLE